MSRSLWALAGVLVLTPGFMTQAGADLVGLQLAVNEPVVYLDVQASTWRPRGRISFGIEPVLRMKLISAGFTVTQDPAQQHDLTVRVEYREERGEPIAVNLYGTDISCRILLDHPHPEGVQTISIRETPSYRDLVNAPYVEVVEKLEANPYFYFMGHIVWGWHQHLDRTGALIQARVRRLIYGAADERAGAVVSHFGVCDTDFLNHRIEVRSGVLEPECRALMQEFFKTRRGRIVD